MEIKLRHKSLHGALLFLAVGFCQTLQAEEKGVPVFKLIQESRSTESHICKFELFNRSARSISIVGVSKTRSKKRALSADLDFPPVNWDMTGAPVDHDFSPPGWFESFILIGPPAAPSIHYALQWQARKEETAVQPGQSLVITLPLDAREKIQCSQLYWSAGRAASFPPEEQETSNRL